MDELSAAFNGRTVAKLSVQPQNPDGIGPVVISIEFEGGGSLGLVTDQRITAVVPTPVGLRPMLYAPLLTAPRRTARGAR